MSTPKELQNPDLKGGPFSEVPYGDRVAEWREASKLWAKMPEGKRSELLARLQEMGVDTDHYLDLANIQPQPDD